jgi:hypothetical protein
MTYLDEAVKAVGDARAGGWLSTGEIVLAAELAIRADERAKLEAQLRQVLDALEVAALGGYDEELMPEDLVANPYEERGLVRVTRDISDEYYCHMTADGVAFVRNTIEETRAALASHPTPDGETPTEAPGCQKHHRESCEECYVDALTTPDGEAAEEEFEDGAEEPWADDIVSEDCK